MRSSSRFALTQNSRISLFLFVLSGIFATSISSGAELEEIRDHVFFLGLDVFILQPEGFRPVESFKPGSVNVVTDAGSRVVPMGDVSTVDTRIEPKVSPTSVSVSGIQGYRSYTSRNDPWLNSLRTESRLIAEQMRMETTVAIAEAKLRAAEDNISTPMPANTNAVTQAETAPNHQTTLANALGRMHLVDVGKSIESYDPIWEVNDLDTSQADAYAVEFKILSEESIENGYVVLLTNILYPEGSAPVRALEFARLSLIGNEPKKMKMVQSPLPVGYQVYGNEVHVYRGNGREVATNLSPKRVELTKTEAYDFLLFRYVSTNRFANLPPSVVRDLLPSEMQVYIPWDQFDRIAHIGVDEHGAVSSVYLEGGDSAGDEFLGKAIQNVYFYPALAFGEPVETKTTVKLAEFVR